MSNTQIQIKRSSNTAVPPNGALIAGQPGYSYLSNLMFIGNATGNGIETVGGRYFVDVINAMSSANAANNLVKRDANGDFAGRVITATTFSGTATLASALSPGRYIAATGDVTANALFDGTTNYNTTFTLVNSGVTAATYGAADGSQIPVIIVDSKGRITSAANAATPAGSSFTFRSNSGTDAATAGDSINIYGGDGLSSTILANTGNTIISIAVDSTVVRTTGTQSIGGAKTFSGDVIVSGNLTISGTQTFANTQRLDIGDNILSLNADLPIGTAPSENAGIEINRGNVNGNASIYWDETNKWWTAVANVVPTGASANGRIHTDGYANATALIVGTVPSARMSGSYTSITGLGTITAGTWQGTNVAVGFGGTGRSSFTTNGVLYGNNTGDLIASVAPTEGQILQGNASGVPTFGMLDCGTF